MFKSLLLYFFCKTLCCVKYYFYICIVSNFVYIVKGTVLIIKHLKIYMHEKLKMSEKNPHFEDKNIVKKISGPPAVWEKLIRFCKSERISHSKFVVKAILEKLNRENYE